MNPLQQRMYIGLKELAKQRGWELISNNYVNDSTKLLFKCAKGHPREITPSNFKQGKGCAKCSGLDPVNAQLLFENRIKEFGGILVGNYVNSKTSVDIICTKGHPSSVIPNKIQQGRGICRICAGNDPGFAEEKFINRVTELGGTIVTKYYSVHKPVEIMCPNGDLCNVK
jgi:hypothetical protein